MRKFTLVIIAITIAILLRMHVVNAAPPKSSVKSKFYDFSEQLIDGEIKKPTALYTDSRQKVKFDRLLKLKRSFMKELFDTAKEKVFK